jgi:hypothetical protein
MGRQRLGGLNSSLGMVGVQIEVWSEADKKLNRVKEEESPRSPTKLLFELLRLSLLIDAMNLLP